MNEAIIIHGGCGNFDLSDLLEKERLEAQKNGLEKAITHAWERLLRGASALDVAVDVVEVLECDPSFNAGIGAAIGQDGHIALDASVMEGDSLGFGAVAGLREFACAARIAKEVMEESPAPFLIGQSATSFARNRGHEPLLEASFYTPYQLTCFKKESANPAYSPAKFGTVGSVVKDSSGSIAACTSTGGYTCKPYGRVGDSCVIGAGTYADSRFGGASCTGYGEQIIKTGLARFIIDAMRFQGIDAKAATELGVGELSRLRNGFGAVIAIDARSRIGWSCTEKFLPRAFMRSELGSPCVELRAE